MNTQEKSLARILFENKIRKSNGNTFEDLFTSIMNYADADFEQIKPWGNIGDRKNDGFIRSKGIYYQVFAPEEIKLNYPETINKLKTDFKGLKSKWSPINEYYFVVNDKYAGVNADANNTMSEIVKTNKLNAGKILTAKDLESILFSLPDHVIIKIVGFLPDINDLNKIDFSVLNQVIGHIMQSSVHSSPEVIKFPDWYEKIKFNGLSDYTKTFLDSASINLGSLNQFLVNENFLAEELQKKLIGIYNDLKFDLDSDKLFWEIVDRCSPKSEQQFLSPVLTIVAKYFESCDIFEEPI